VSNSGSGPDAARERLLSFLEDPSVRLIDRRFREVPGLDPIAALRYFLKHRVFPALIGAVPSPPDEFLRERYLLATASLQSLERIEALPLPQRTKELLWKEYLFFAQPDKEWLWTFGASTRNYTSYASLALLEHFPAGQLNWNVSGIPRSWLPRITLRDMPRVLTFIANRFRGLRPCFDVHVPSRRSPMPVLMERACHQSYRVIAEALLLQPEIRGIAAFSWLYATETQEVSPHLSWMNRMVLDNGGLISHLGYAPPDSGFLEGSVERKRLYEAGLYRPRYGLMLWPRDALLDWAARNRETPRPRVPAQRL
jgi:hypothetical protein